MPALEVPLKRNKQTQATLMAHALHTCICWHHPLSHPVLYVRSTKCRV